MSEFDPVGYLAAKGHRGRPASGGREMAFSCFFECQEPPDTKKRKLYLEVATGFYHCKRCGAAGGAYTLQRHFGDEPRSGTNDDVFARRRILDAAVERGVTILRNNDEPLLYLLNDRGLSPETIESRQLGFVAGGWSLIGTLPPEFTAEQLKSTGLVHRDGSRAGKDFFFRHILIPVISRGHTLQLRGRAWGEVVGGGKYMTGPGEPPRVYNIDSLDGAEEVILTEGEFDCMVLAQHLAESTEPRVRAIAVVGIPGASAIPEEFDDVLSGAKRIYLGLDSDEPGTRAAVMLKERIGPRARILSLPFEDGRKCDWTTFLLPGDVRKPTALNPYAGHGWRDVMRLLSSAAGKRVFSVAESGEAFRAYRDVHDGLKTGYTLLDETILPGLLPGQLVIILSKTGAGKTLLVCNLAYNMRAHKVLFLSLEMTREEIYDRLRRIYLFHNPRHDDQDAEVALANVFICDENRLGERDLAALVSEFVVEADARPEVVIVDYLGYYARGAKGNSPYEKVSNAVMQLKSEAKAGRFVVIAPAQVNRGAKEGKPIDLDDARDAGQVEETADFLLALFRPDDALTADGLINESFSGRGRISILKSRHGGKGQVLSVQMDLLTLAIVDSPSMAGNRAEQHNRLLQRGLDWDHLRRQDRAPEQLRMGDDP